VGEECPCLSSVSGPLIAHHCLFAWSRSAPATQAPDSPWGAPVFSLRLRKATGPITLSFSVCPCLLVPHPVINSDIHVHSLSAYCMLALLNGCYSTGKPSPSSDNLCRTESWGNSDKWHTREDTEEVMLGPSPMEGGLSRWRAEKSSLGRGHNTLKGLETRSKGISLPVQL
jgi:hypothetical protein